MSEEPPRYLAYMLRIWQASAGGNLSWRATLESPHTGERQGFPDLKSLFAFLEEKTSIASQTEPARRTRTTPLETPRPAQLILNSMGADATQQRLAESAGHAAEQPLALRPEEE
jgi:hypothetical protein